MIDSVIVCIVDQAVYITVIISIIPTIHIYRSCTSSRNFRFTKTEGRDQKASCAKLSLVKGFFTTKSKYNKLYYSVSSSCSGLVKYWGTHPRVRKYLRIMVAILTILWWRLPLPVPSKAPLLILLSCDERNLVGSLEMTYVSGVLEHPFGL